MIANAKTPDDADRLVSAGANAFVYSMMDLAVRLRAFYREPWGFLREFK